MTTYYIYENPVLKVEYEGDPPCLWCGNPVKPPGSMDGPLVCPLCDCGDTQDENGMVRKWTATEYQERSKHYREMIEKITQDNEKEQKEKEDRPRYPFWV